MNELYENALNKLKSLLDKFMSCFKGKSELEKFITKSKENLYNDDGSLTEEYENRIKEMELYVKEHPISETLRELHQSEEEKAVDSAVIDFVEKRRDLLADLADRISKINKEETGVDKDVVMEWTDERLRKSENCNAVSDYDILIDDEIIEVLEDEKVKAEVQNLDKLED